jgi:homoserine dehydrogenase
LGEHVNEETEEIHAVVNGTLNYIFDGLSRGRSLGELVDETKRLGYVEPGAENPVEIINKEAMGDVPMKTSILFNSCDLVEERMRAIDISVHRIDESDLDKLIKESAERRYIVSIGRKSNENEDFLCGFGYEFEGWYISGGFRLVNDNPLYKKLVPSGVDNSVLISEGKFGRDWSYVVAGPGAGAGPTTSSMLKDAERILS